MFQWRIQVLGGWAEVGGRVRMVGALGGTPPAPVGGYGGYGGAL